VSERERERERKGREREKNKICNKNTIKVAEIYKG